MKKLELRKFDIIINTSPSKFIEIGKIKRAQAQNYKNSSSLPPLDKAYLFEKSLNIPMNLWIELKKYREKKNNVYY